jgi:hypothetical protein
MAASRARMAGSTAAGSRSVLAANVMLEAGVSPVPVDGVCA